MSSLNAPIIELDVIDSTNNYAMQLIDADTALPGLTITARRQTSGRGQRGRQWTDIPDQSVLMSVIVRPRHTIEEQFLFNATVALAIADVLQALNEQWDVRIKWPNDIIINDKKAGGILIENVLRGSIWVNSIVGFGLNVNQERFPAELPHAASLKMLSSKDYDINLLMRKLREAILINTATRNDSNMIMLQYNSTLYKKGEVQSFEENGVEWEAIVVEANNKGMLVVQQPDGTIRPCTHGLQNWLWK